MPVYSRFLEQRLECLKGSGPWAPEIFWAPRRPPSVLPYPSLFLFFLDLYFNPSSLKTLKTFTKSEREKARQTTSEEAWGPSPENFWRPGGRDPEDT